MFLIFLCEFLEIRPPICFTDKASWYLKREKFPCSSETVHCFSLISLYRVLFHRLCYDWDAN